MLPAFGRFRSAACVLCLVLIGAVAPAQAPPALSRVSHVLAPGVELIQEVTPDGAPDGPLTVTVLKIDPRRGARVCAALGQDRVWGDDPTFGRETVSRYLARHLPVVAAINAGFFPFAGNPIGLHVQNGEMVTEPQLNRSAFCILKNGKAAIEAFTFAGSVSTERSDTPDTLVLDGMNRRPGRGSELLLFTPRWGQPTLRARGRVEVIVSASGAASPRQTLTGKVIRVSEGGGTPVLPGTLVLSAGGADADRLRHLATPGARVSVDLDARPLSGTLPVQDIREAVTGGPRLLTGGKVTVRWAEEGMGQAFSTLRHPRTAVGITGQGEYLLVTVDGRQKGLSRGASLPELAQMLLKFGAINALNLDGGGSSCVMGRGLILNAPSDGSERPVANFLTVTASVKPSSAIIAVKTAAKPLLPTRALFPGETWALVPPVQEKGRDVWKRGVWGLPGGQPVVGFISQSGVFHAMRPGTASVTFVGDDGTPISASITVIADPKMRGQSLTEPPPPAARTGAPLP